MNQPIDKQAPRVVVISASVGSGHNQAAKAVIEALAMHRPDAQVELIDAMECVPRHFRAYYAGGFALSMTRMPRLYGLGFRIADHPQGPDRGLIERLRLWWEARELGRLREALPRSRPDLIVNTHFLAPPMTAGLIAAGKLACPQVTVVTDIEVHRWWFSEAVDRWFLPSQYSAGPLARWGIPPERITVSGIPIRPKWLSGHDRAKVLEDFGLPADRQIVLLSGGTEFTCGPVVRIARDMVRACLRACVVVLAGRNKDLLAQLSKLALPAESLVPMGYTDRMPELAEVASLMVTKAGGITTAECLSKGLPMVFLRPVPGQEGGNARYFERQGAGIITRKPAQVIAAVKRLLESPDELNRLAEGCRKLYNPASQIISESIGGML